MLRTRRSRLLFLPLGVSLAVVAGVVVVPPATAAPGEASISGVVTDAATGDPLQGAEVTLYEPVASPGAIEVVPPVFTDEFGAYSLTGLDEGTYKLWVNPAGATYQPEWYPSGFSFGSAETFDLADAEALTADVALDAKGTISGTVRGANGPSGETLTVLVYRYEGGVYAGYASGGGSSWDSTTYSWSVDVPPGQYRVRVDDSRPEGPGSYRTEVFDNVFDLEDGDEVTVVSGETTVVPQITMSTLGPVANERLSGANRYETAVAVSQQFDSFEGAEGSYVYVASGANYPDALSAGPAAAVRGAPLLLTEGSSLPTAVRDELIRLEPETVIIAGGSAVVSNSVRSAIDAVVDTVVRIGGANRYETSRLLVEDAFTSASDAFIATGANFPDALAATAAAAQKSAPVILVDGAASSVPSATRSLIGSGGLGVTDVYIAGGTAVVSNGVRSSLEGIDSVSSVTRLGGADRYATSLLINSEIFVTQNIADDPNAFFAVGTGFADALAGAALAGAQSPSAPLFTVPRTCVPSDVLDLFATMKVEKIWLLGGTAVLANGVRDLSAC